MPEQNLKAAQQSLYLCPSLGNVYQRLMIMWLIFGNNYLLKLFNDKKKTPDNPFDLFEEFFLCVGGRGADY